MIPGSRRPVCMSHICKSSTTAWTRVSRACESRQITQKQKNFESLVNRASDFRQKSIKASYKRGWCSVVVDQQELRSQEGYALASLCQVNAQSPGLKLSGTLHGKMEVSKTHHLSSLQTTVLFWRTMKVTEVLILVQALASTTEMFHISLFSQSILVIVLYTLQ